tara:strand:- start:278 stop:562 length:285 start_codon:yes stop_codon:yes gene_type:complete
MKWIKQIFGIKEDDTQENVDAFLEQRKFANATKTNELVISPNAVNTSEVKTHTKSSLNKLTKVQLEELAKSEFGLELDRRKKKDLLVTEIINAQ